MFFTANSGHHRLEDRILLLLFVLRLDISQRKYRAIVWPDLLVICLLFFTIIDISEIKIKNIAPRYSEQVHIHNTLWYYVTPFYDVYMCTDDTFNQNRITNYTIVPKNYFLTKEELENE